MRLRKETHLRAQASSLAKHDDTSQAASLIGQLVHNGANMQGRNLKMKLKSLKAVYRINSLVSSA